MVTPKKEIIREIIKRELALMSDEKLESELAEAKSCLAQVAKAITHDAYNSRCSLIQLFEQEMDRRKNKIVHQCYTV